MTTNTNFPYVLLHDCGYPAFRLAVKPESLDQVTPDIIQGLDGKDVHANTVAVCGSCGANLKASDFRISNIVEASQFYGNTTV